MADTVAECPLPSDVYCDAPEESYLLLSCLATLWGQQEGRWLSPNYSVRPRNDMVRAAQELLEADRFLIFLRCSEALGQSLPCYPSPCPVLARVTAGLNSWPTAFSLWEAVRQVVSLLQFEPPRHSHMQGSRSRSFTVGIYGRAQLVGLCKATLPHTNVCKLLCRYVSHLSEFFCWTSIAVNVKYNTPVHRDIANSSDMSLLTMLSSTEKGGLWVQTDAGCDYQEVPGGTCAGSSFQLQDQYIIFPAQSAWRSTQGWEHYDRATLAVYSRATGRIFPSQCRIRCDNLVFACLKGLANRCSPCGCCLQ